MYISQDRTNLEMCKSVFGDDFEFDPDVVEDPDLVVAIGDVHGDVEALMQALVLSGLVKWNGHDINTIRCKLGNVPVYVHEMHCLSVSLVQVALECVHQKNILQYKIYPDLLRKYILLHSVMYNHSLVGTLLFHFHANKIL